MADNHSKSQRSYNMSRIRGTNTAPEEKVRKYLFSKGFRYRKNKHSCRRFVWPSSNQEYWHSKINGNVLRDEKNHRLLEAEGWNVVVVWECELKKRVFNDTMAKLVRDIQTHSVTPT